MAAIEVSHRPEQRRWVAPIRGGEARLDYRELPDGRIDFYRTWVPTEARGRGIAAALVRSALAWARERGAQVVPSCSYVQAYVERHPDEADVGS